jgi:hypothetical protein
MAARRAVRSLTWIFVAVIPACLGVGCSGAQSHNTPSDPSALQVTAFGVLALPGSAEIDPELADVAPTLHKLLPNYGFRRVGLKSKRLSVGQEIRCPLGNGRSAQIVLMDSAASGGKVKMKFTLKIASQEPFIDIVSTPPNQLVLVDRMLPSKERLLVGMAAR